MSKLTVLIACAYAMALLSTHADGARSRQASTLKNIKVLTDLSDQQIDDAMMYFRGSLGVQCEHCHDRDDWSLDTKEEKRTAREMIKMVRELNRSLGNDLAVSCYSCHRGQLRPVTTLPLVTERPTRAADVAQDVSPAHDAVKATTASKAVGADFVMKRYLEATGGTAWSRLTSRAMKGRLVTSEPAVYPAELWQRAPNQFRSRILVDGAPFTKVFDGTRGWGIDNNGTTEAHGAELERLHRQAAFALPVDLKQFYPALSVEGESTVGTEAAFVLHARGSRDRIFFSTRSGLLLRIESPTETPFGLLPRRWDYEDYRKVDGVRLPFKVRETDPDYTYLWEFSSVRHNLPVDASLFTR
jgi:hypothetical protein